MRWGWEEPQGGARRCLFASWIAAFGTSFSSDAGDLSFTERDGQIIFTLDLGNGNVITQTYSVNDAAYFYVAQLGRKITAAGPGGVDKFTIYAVDADGSVAESALTFTVQKPASEMESIRADEANIGQGVPITLLEGYEISEVIQQGSHGHVEKVDGKWVYVLDEAIDSSDE